MSYHVQLSIYVFEIKNNRVRMENYIFLGLFNNLNWIVFDIKFFNLIALKICKIV